MQQKKIAQTNVKDTNPSFSCGKKALFLAYFSGHSVVYPGHIGQGNPSNPDFSCQSQRYPNFWDQLWRELNVTDLDFCCSNSTDEW